MNIPQWIQLSPEVRDAVETGRPVVALESTVLAQGLPRPLNLEVGQELERVVRAGGAVPATVAIVDGAPTLGLRPEQLERIATDETIPKRSTRDIAVSMVRRESGATTVAATAFIAARAGVCVFATGGIGGVHHGAPLDVSADLMELQRTPIIVVSAGAKSVLDLPATREILETLGVLVLGWRTDVFPAFYSIATGLTVDARVDGAEEVASLWEARRQLEVPGSILICAPVPVEYAVPGDVIEAAIERALAGALEVGIRGKDVTPYLLREIATATGGSSIEANVALLRNNAAVAAEIATAIASGRAAASGS